MQAKLLMVEGRVQRESDVIHVVAQHCHDLSPLLRTLGAADASQGKLLTLSRADIHTDSGGDARTQPKEVVQAEIFGEGRNFR